MLRMKYRSFQKRNQKILIFQKLILRESILVGLVLAIL